MYRPPGIKIAVGMHILLLVFLAASSYYLQGDLEKTKIYGRETAAAGGEPYDQEFYDIVGMLYNAMMALGMLNVVPAYLIWNNERFARQASTLLTLLCGVLVWVTFVLFLPLAYLLWLHRETKGYFEFRAH